MKPIRSILAVLSFAALLCITGCGSSETETAAAPEPKVEKEEAPPEPLTGKHVVIMETTKGDVKIELDADAAPNTVTNFLDYVDRKFYDHTVFHRIRPFMVQGGGFTMDTTGLTRKWTKDPVPSEADNGLSNQRGTIAMARGEDPDSAAAQFFINVRNNSQLDKNEEKDRAGYTVFGKVLEGMDVVDQISKSKTVKKGSHENYPAVPIFISKIRVVPAEESGNASGGA